MQSFQIEVEIKTFPNKQKLKECITGLTGMLKGLLQVEKKRP